MSSQEKKKKKNKGNGNVKNRFRFKLSVKFKIITLDLTRICRMQLSCKSMKLSVICSKSSLKSNLKNRILCLSTTSHIKSYRHSWPACTTDVVGYQHHVPY